MTSWNEMLRRHGCNIPKAREGLSKARFEVLVARHGRDTAKQIKAEELAAKLAKVVNRPNVVVVDPTNNHGVALGRGSIAIAGPPHMAIASKKDAVGYDLPRPGFELAYGFDVHRGIPRILHTVGSKKYQTNPCYNLPSEKRARLKRRIVSEHLKQLEDRGK